MTTSIRFLLKWQIFLIPLERFVMPNLVCILTWEFRCVASRYVVYRCRPLAPWRHRAIYWCCHNQNMVWTIWSALVDLMALAVHARRMFHSPNDYYWVEWSAPCRWSSSHAFSSDRAARNCTIHWCGTVRWCNFAIKNCWEWHRHRSLRWCLTSTFVGDGKGRCNRRHGKLEGQRAVMSCWRSLDRRAWRRGWAQSKRRCRWWTDSPPHRLSSIDNNTTDRARLRPETFVEYNWWENVRGIRK